MNTTIENHQIGGLTPLKSVYRLFEIVLKANSNLQHTVNHTINYLTVAKIAKNCHEMTHLEEILHRFRMTKMGLPRSARNDGNRCFDRLSMTKKLRLPRYARNDENRPHPDPLPLGEGFISLPSRGDLVGPKISYSTPKFSIIFAPLKT
jgi:hypothetical protein